MSEINHFKLLTVQDYVAHNIVMIYQLVDDVTIDNVNILHVKENDLVSHINIDI
jgi:hypothetical protein